MKRSFTLIICLFLFQIVKANVVTFKYQDPLKRYNDTTLSSVNLLSLNSSQSIVYKRLDSLKKDIPLDYNEYVQAYIDSYGQRRDEMGHILGLTKYYFPIYEKAFRDAGIPEEIKYLSIVESELNPNAVSRVGATGPWQFIATTAKIYGLDMNDYVDDRKDPVRASNAAAAYLKDAYEEFGDWLLAIASYNCGKSNVEHAMEKTGANDFWSIRAYLPPETRGYVPAYIATVYLMNYYSKHNIVPHSSDMILKTDTLVVNKFISMDNLARALNMDVRELDKLNPSYKQGIVNGTPRAPRRLIIPQVNKQGYAVLYEAIKADKTYAGQPLPVYVAPAPAVAIARTADETAPEWYVVKKGETLADIAGRYGIDIDDIKTWNHLQSSKNIYGKRLKLRDDVKN